MKRNPKKTAGGAWPEKGLRQLAAERNPYVDAFFEYAVLLLFAVTFLLAFRTNTAIPYTVLDQSIDLIRNMRIIVVLVVLAKVLWEKDWRLAEMLLGLLLFGALLRSWQHVPRWRLVDMAALIIGAHNIRFTKILKVYLCVAVTALLAVMVLALTGVIENLVFYRAGRARISFGMSYPTDFSAMVFFLISSWIWLREDRLTWWEIGGVAVLAALLYIFCEARNTVMCLVLLVICLGALKLRRRQAERAGRTFRMSRWARIVCTWAMPVLALAILALSYGYNSESGLMAFLNKLLSGRLALGRQAFETYAMSGFGQDVYMQGLGLTNGVVEDYFFLDSSYVNILFCYGIVTLEALMLNLFLAGLRERKNGAWVHLGLLAVIALQCMFEHHLMDISMHPFMLLPFAASGPSLWELGETETRE